jgi:hypothetical protein
VSNTSVINRKGCDDVDSELLKQLEDLYYNQKLSSRQVAAILKIGSKTVIGYLNTYSNGTREKSESCLLRTTDEYREKLRISQLGENNTAVKLTAKNVLKIRKEYEELLLDGYKKTEAQYKLAGRYGVKRPTISDVVLRKTWKHI